MKCQVVLWSLCRGYEVFWCFAKGRQNCGRIPIGVERLHLSFWNFSRSVRKAPRRKRSVYQPIEHIRTIRNILSNAKGSGSGTWRSLRIYGRPLAFGMAARRPAKEKSSAIQTITELSFGTPEGTRTPSLQNRNLTLYPIELRAHTMLSLLSLVIISGLPPVVKGKLKTFFWKDCQRGRAVLKWNNK